jgi:hypothetical protein
MPTPTHIRLRNKQLDKVISQSPAERERQRAEKVVKTEAPGGIGKWALYFMMFLVCGSGFFQIFSNIQNSPSMSDTH